MEPCASHHDKIKIEIATRDIPKYCHGLGRGVTISRTGRSRIGTCSEGKLGLRNSGNKGHLIRCGFYEVILLGATADFESLEVRM